jgi:ABC-2 type transport system ATP-binding protein
MRDGALQIDGLSKRYGPVVALRDMTFDVRAGELFGFVGSNGAGKTTTMRIVLGVLTADAGEVRYDGTPLTIDTRRRIGYMPEERGLYPKMRVGEQLEYLAQLHGMTAPAARAGTRAWAERLGIAHRLGDDVQALSLGNQQRAQLAAALIHDPTVLVLDEPFSGLDPIAVDVMSDVLRERAAAGVPTVFSSHQLDLVERLCDRVGIVSAGQMVAVGSVDELRTGGESVLVVDAPDAPTGWADTLPGVLAASRDDHGRTEVRLATGADDQTVLRAALATGPVHEFAHRHPTLSQLFREVVTHETPAPEPPATPRSRRRRLIPTQPAHGHDQPAPTGDGQA